MRCILKYKNLRIVLKTALIIMIFSVCIGAVLLISQNKYTNSLNDVSLVKASEIKIPVRNLAINSNINSNINKGTLEENLQGVDQVVSSRKVAYLTFDDGPSADTTPQIIGILNKYNIKATFFVIGQYAAVHPEILKFEVDEGFIVANHTYSHNIDYLYSDSKNLVEDFKKNEILLKSILPGYNSKLVRFPGGSRQRDKQYIAAMKNEGYKIVDWNCLSKDAENSKYTVDDLVNNIKNTSKGKNNLIVLMHDSSGRQTTIEALPKIIEYLKAEGYIFEI